MRLLFTAVLGFVLVFVTACEKQEEKTELKTLNEKASYTMGLDIGKNVAKGQYEVDLKTFMKGVEDGMSGKEPMLSDSARQATMETFEIERQKRVKARMEEQGKINKVEGEKFLAANKNKEGIITFPSGVQMKIIEQGTGKKPNRGDVIAIYFTGRFLDGTVFDYTNPAGKPLEITMAQLLPGQQQVLSEIQEGGKAIAFIPPNMAFGQFGGGELIPPHTTLVYEMELVKVNSQK